MDNKKLFTVLILSLIIAYLCYNFLNIKHPLYLALVIIVTFVIVLVIYKKKNRNKNKKEQYVSEYNFKEVDWKQTEKDKNFNQENKPKLFREKKLPFDGLNENEMKNRFNYLYYATSNPFKPKSYKEWKLDENHDEINSLKHLKLLEKDYPEMSSDMLNAKDCLNHPIGSKLSCNQSNSILVQGINKENKDMVLKEDFKPPDNIVYKVNSQIFKKID